MTTSSMLQRFQEIANDQHGAKHSRNTEKTKTCLEKETLNSDNLSAARSRISEQNKKRATNVGRPRKNDAEKNKRIDISLAPQVIERLEFQARRIGLSKSAYIAYLITNENSEDLQRPQQEVVHKTQPNIEQVTKQEFISDLKKEHPEIQAIDIDANRSLDEFTVHNGENEIFYSNGSIRARFHVENDRKNGHFAEFWPNEYPKTEGKFINGSKGGVWYSYFDNGYLESKGLYVENLRDGLWVENFENGIIWSETNYFRGLRNGFQKIYDPDGNLISINNYEMGRLESHEVVHDEEYNVSVTKDVIESYANGNISKKGRIVAGRKTGVWTWYYPNGKIWITTEYKNGLICGPFNKFFEDGAAKLKGSFEQGKFIGKWTFLDKNSKIIKEVSH